MKLLLDTHLLLWAAGLPDRLSPEARKFIDNPVNELLFSAASLWEVLIKRGLGRDDFKVDARVLRRGLLDNGYSELPVVSDHLVAIDSLPPVHKDPFDRVSDGTGNCRGYYTTRYGLLGREVPWPNPDGVSAIQCRSWQNSISPSERSYPQRYRQRLSSSWRTRWHRARPLLLPTQ